MSTKYLALSFNLEVLFISETAVTKLHVSGVFSAPSGVGQNGNSLPRGIILALKVYFFSQFSRDLRENHNVACPAFFSFLWVPCHCTTQAEYKRSMQTGSLSPLSLLHSAGFDCHMTCKSANKWPHGNEEEHANMGNSVKPLSHLRTSADLGLVND